MIAKLKLIFGRKFLAQSLCSKKLRLLNGNWSLYSGVQLYLLGRYSQGWFQTVLYFLTTTLIPRRPFFQAERIDLLHPLISVSIEWEECRDQPNLPRKVTQSVLLNDTLYISDPDHPVLYKYNMSMKSWYTLQTEVSNYALATYCSKVVLIGGLKGRACSEKCVTVLDDTNNLEDKLNSAITDPDKYRFKNARAASDGEYLIVIDEGTMTIRNGHQFVDCTVKTVRVFNGKMWIHTSFRMEGDGPHQVVINSGQVYVFTDTHCLYQASLDSFTKSPLELKWEKLEVRTSLTNIGDQWVLVTTDGHKFFLCTYSMTCQKPVVEDTDFPFCSIASRIGVPVSEHQSKQLELWVVGRMWTNEGEKVSVAKINFTCKLIMYKYE